MLKNKRTISSVVWTDGNIKAVKKEGQPATIGAVEVDLPF